MLCEKLINDTKVLLLVAESMLDNVTMLEEIGVSKIYEGSSVDRIYEIVNKLHNTLYLECLNVPINDLPNYIKLRSFMELPENIVSDTLCDIDASGKYREIYTALHDEITLKYSKLLIPTIRKLKYNKDIVNISPYTDNAVGIYPEQHVIQMLEDTIIHHYIITAIARNDGKLFDYSIGVNLDESSIKNSITSFKRMLSDVGYDQK